MVCVAPRAAPNTHIVMIMNAMSKNTAKNFYAIKQDAAVRDDARQAAWAQSTRSSGKIQLVRKRSENI